MISWIKSACVAIFLHVKSEKNMFTMENCLVWAFCEGYWGMKWELFIFVKLLNSRPCGILGYATIASDVYRITCGSVGVLPCFCVSINKNVITCLCNIPYVRYSHFIHLLALWNSLFVRSTLVSNGTDLHNLPGEGKVCYCLEHFSDTPPKEVQIHTHTHSQAKANLYFSSLLMPSQIQPFSFRVTMAFRYL